LTRKCIEYQYAEGDDKHENHIGRKHGRILCGGRRCFIPALDAGRERRAATGFITHESFHALRLTSRRQNGNG
jgi:hypothetical protein